ncbi:MAG: serine--tRNA ligase [Acidobacteria bacterium]|nr:serine--tRNA ligase [Acidobacteriota bacterium]
MLDLKFIRENLDQVQAMLDARNNSLDLSAFPKADQRRREILVEVEQLKQERNSGSKQIGVLIKQGQDVTELKAQIGAIGEKIKALESELGEAEEALNSLVPFIPNMIRPEVPKGHSEEDNQEVSRWGEVPTFDFPVKDHVDLGTALGIFDFERATKVTGTRFTVLRGDAARLERALIQFMIDVHEEQGYFEVMPPFMVNGDSMFGTGQFPKMKEDVFKLEGMDYYLVPTAEVPVTNLHRDEILDPQQLPIQYQAFTPCFRSEAGAYGRDTRGLIRQHQFNKVELVWFTKPEASEACLEQLRQDAESILQKLKLPYRVMLLCSGDISFSAAKCYDLEVWLPGQNTYREISSCSNFWDFQARRAKIRTRNENGKPEFVHTLNGSGLAVGRTLLAILENYQQADGTVRVPEVLVPYMNGKTIIEKQRM